MSLQDGSVKITVGRSRGKIALAFLGIVELVLTAVFVVTLASNILFPDQTSAAANAVSKIISYEGRLTDASGNPLGGTGTNYCFRFSIYDNATVGAGTKLWPTGTPTTNTVNVVNGVFTVGIGEADDLGSYNFYENDTIFLNIEATSSLAASCAGQTSFVTLSPRQRIDAVAFARASRDVYGNLLKTVNASNLVQIGSGTGAASPILLGLDWKNVADGTLSYVGQSCSVNGTMWYNSSVSRALICEGGLVQELGSAATTTIAAIGTNATAPISAGTIVFSNGNGVTFGQNGSTITASVNAGGGGLTNINLSAGTTSNNLSNFVLSNSNGVSFGLNGSTITASHNGLSNLNLSAGTTSNNLSNIVFSNSNGVSFGLNGSTMTASVNAGGGGGATLQYFNYRDGYLQVVGQQGQGTLHIQPWQSPNVTYDRIAMPLVLSYATNSTGSITISAWLGLYTRNVSTLSLLSSVSTTQGITFSGTANSSLLSGPRLITIGTTGFMSETQYYIGVISRTTTGGANGSFSQLLASQLNSNFSGILGNASAASAQYTRGLGIYSATTTALPNSIAFSEIRGTGSLALRPPLLYFVSGTY